MQGSDAFTQYQAGQIREFLHRKTRADRDEQKRIRQGLRRLRFYISDFADARAGFTAADFDRLVQRGAISIIGESGPHGRSDRLASRSQPAAAAASPPEGSSSRFEILRSRYRPAAIKVLFVGESPPAGGTFFYLGNSILARHTQRAFQEVYRAKFTGPCEFLTAFAGLGCFLDDLCLSPVNRTTSSGWGDRTGARR